MDPCRHGSRPAPAGHLAGGALIAWFVPVHRKVVASAMAAGAGFLVSAAAFGLVATAGFLVTFTISRAR